MKFDAHVSSVGFILYLVARLFQASESKSEFCPTFFISPSESELNSMRCGTGVHTHP